jgi:phosphoglycolate phosphatase-like HAD superfamily hydrolase
MTTYDAVFFDFDGVLAESADIKTVAFVEMYKQYGPEVVDNVVAHHLEHGGISRRQKIRHCHKTFLGIEVTSDEMAVLGRRFSVLVEDAVVAADWVAGARAFLDAHCGRLAMFVISGTPEEELKRITARRGMDGYFVSVRGSPPVKEPIIVELLAEHGLRPDRVLFVGDTMTDYRAATATGLAFIGRVPPGERSPFPDGTPLVPDLTGLTI